MAKSFAAAALAAQALIVSACPGSPAYVMHASASLTVDFAVSCQTVATEIVARVDGTGGWVDPHNAGTYSCIGTCPTDGTTTINIKRVTGGAGTCELLHHAAALSFSWLAFLTPARCGLSCGTQTRTKWTSHSQRSQRPAVS